MPTRTRQRKSPAIVRRERERRLNTLVVFLGLDDTLKFQGVDYEGRSLHVHHRTEHHLVVHVGGGMCWASVGEREYAPARFEVYDIVGGAGNELLVEHVIAFDIKCKRHDEPPDVSRRPFGKRFP